MEPRLSLRNENEEMPGLLADFNNPTPIWLLNLKRHTFVLTEFVMIILNASSMYWSSVSKFYFGPRQEHDSTQEYFILLVSFDAKVTELADH